MAEKYYSLTNIVKLCDNLIAAMPTSFYDGIMAVWGGLVTAPAADVVPVVRCADCKYNITPDKLYARCGFNYALGPQDFFCSAGERKDGGGDV